MVFREGLTLWGLMPGFTGRSHFTTLTKVFLLISIMQGYKLIANRYTKRKQISEKCRKSNHTFECCSED